MNTGLVGGIAVFLAVTCGVRAEPAAIRRRSDPVVVTGERIPAMAGVPITHIALYSMRGGKAVAVPFQIDEKDRRGALSLTSPAGKPVNPDDGKWDSNDELVFMSLDLGGRASKGDLPQGCSAAIEIACTDQNTGGTGWVYCIRFQGPVPYEGGRYVSYDLAKDYVNAECYELGYTAGAMKSYFSTLILKDAAGGARSLNILDRFKFRIKITLFFSLIKINRTEDDMSSVLLGYKNGPVRAIRQCNNTVYIKFGIRSPTSIADNFYYPDSIEWPTLISLPFNVSTIATEAFLTTGCDWNEAATGMEYFNSRNPSHVLVDGVMSEQEKKLDRSAYLWSALSGHHGTLISRLWLSDSLGAMGKELLYIDDKDAADPPDDVKGHWGYNGWFFNVTAVPKGTHEFISYFYFPRDYKPGDERQFLDIIDHPLKVDTRRL